MRNNCACAVQFAYMCNGCHRVKSAFQGNATLPFSFIFFLLFSACLYESIGSYCSHPNVGFGLGFVIGVILLRLTFFYVMGKALSGELSSTRTSLINSCPAAFSGEVNF